MLTPARAGLLILATVSLMACGSAPLNDTSAGIGPLEGDNVTGGLVLTGRDLYEHNGTLLRYLYARVPGLQVDYGASTCPRVQIRGQKSLFGSSDPIVYLDGARTSNVCVLGELHTRDLSRVEVYPMGVTNRPGYEAHPNGLILVFQRNGREPDLRSRITD